MRILLIGTPKSGKTKFGKKMAEERDIKLFDGLPQKYMKRTGLALGPISDYRADLMFACNVLELEYKNKDNDYIITAGPLYTYFHFVCRTVLAGNERFMETFFWPAATLSRIIADSLWYDEIYYLPYEGKSESHIFFDEAIREAIKDLGISDRITTVE